MKPSIGRIVHFVPTATNADGTPGTPEPSLPGNHYAAIVTHVWSDTCVNLYVFPKASPYDGAPVQTSVTLDETGSAGNTWHWPERE